MRNTHELLCCVKGNDWSKSIYDEQSTQILYRIARLQFSPYFFGCRVRGREAYDFLKVCSSEQKKLDLFCSYLGLHYIYSCETVVSEIDISELKKKCMRFFDRTEEVASLRQVQGLHGIATRIVND